MAPRKLSTHAAVTARTIPVTAPSRQWLHRSGAANMSDYASSLSGLTINVLSPSYVASLADDNARLQAMEIVGFSHVSPVADTDITAWENAARHHVAYTLAGKGLFAYRKFSAATNPDRQHFYAAGLQQIGHLPLQRINFVSIVNGKVNVDRTILIATDAVAYFEKATVRRVTPDLSRLFGYLITGATDKQGNMIGQFLSADVLTLTVELAGIAETVINRAADQIMAVAGSVADVGGNMPQRITNPTPQVAPNVSPVPASDLASRIAVLQTLGLPAEQFAAIVAQLIATPTVPTLPTDASATIAGMLAGVNAVKIPAASAPINAVTLLAPHKISAADAVPSATDETLPTPNRGKGVAVVADSGKNRKATHTVKHNGTSYVVPITDSAADVRAALDAVGTPSKKSRDTNRLISEKLPLTYVGTYKGKSENGEQRRERAALQLV